MNLVLPAFTMLGLTPAAAKPDAGVGGRGQESHDWLKMLTGKHRMVFDTISAFNGFQVAWPLTFLETHNQEGTPDGDLSVVVVLRNKAVSMALSDQVWKKYKLGRFYKVVDPAINADSLRNFYWDPATADLPEAGTSIRQLMGRGVIFCVCEKALALNSSQVAKSRNLDPAAVHYEWLAGLLPGIQRVPSGVWAINRAQENGASYCYAG